MAEKRRSGRNGNPGNENAPGEEAKEHSKPAGKGSQEPYVNERGEICIGNECFNLVVDAERGEVRVSIDRDECSVDLQETLDELHSVLGRGARTVYETKSTQRKSSSGREKS